MTLDLQSPSISDSNPSTSKHSASAPKAPQYASAAVAEPIQSLIRSIPDYPKPGILFRDISSLIKDARGFKTAIEHLADRYRDVQVDYVAGIEARGFIIGSALSLALGKGFIPVRKKGKLPGDVISHHYDLEYGTDTIEIQRDAFSAGAKILLVDDLLATGGTALAAIHLIEKLQGSVIEAAFFVDLPDLNGSQSLVQAGYPVYSICAFDGH